MRHSTEIQNVVAHVQLHSGFQFYVLFRSHIHNRLLIFFSFDILGLVNVTFLETASIFQWRNVKKIPNCKYFYHTSAPPDNKGMVTMWYHVTEELRLRESHQAMP